MSLSDILQKIIDEASSEAGEIHKEAEEQKQKMSHESDARMNIRHSDIEANGEKVLSQITSKTEALARREDMKMTQSAKQAIVATSLEALYKSLLEVDDAAYGKILEALFSQLGEKTATILAPKERLSITKKIAPKHCEVKGSDRLKGGFIFSFKGGEINNSFESLVYSQYKDELTSYFAQSLQLIS